MRNQWSNRSDYCVVSNMEMMTEHLARIARATVADRHAVVVMYRGSWLQEYLSQDFSNVTLIHTLRYSPELNPIEQI